MECSRCGKNKDLSDFPPRGKICKHCKTLQIKEWQLENKDRHAQVKKKHYIVNKEKYNKCSSEYLKKYYSKDNPDYEKHREQKKIYNKKANERTYLRNWLIKIGLI